MIIRIDKPEFDNNTKSCYQEKISMPRDFIPPKDLYRCGIVKYSDEVDGTNKYAIFNKGRIIDWLEYKGKLIDWLECASYAWNEDINLAFNIFNNFHAENSCLPLKFPRYALFGVGKHSYSQIYRLEMKDGLITRTK